MRMPSLTLTSLLRPLAGAPVVPGMVLVGAMLLASVSWAQGGDPPADADDAAMPAEDPASDDPAPAEVPDAEQSPGAGAAAEAAPTQAPIIGAGATAADYGVQDAAVPPGGRLDWALRRQIRVIQKREVLKEGRHQFSLMGGVVPNDDFFAYIDVGLGYNYYFSEDISVELRGAYTVPQETSLKGSLTKARPDGPGLEVRLPETLNAHVSASATWNLLHGKLGFFTTKLTEFDLGMVFGAGIVVTELQGKAKEQNEKSFAPQGNAGLAALFYLGERFALRVDFRQFFYPANSGGVSFPISTTVGLSYFTAPLE